MCRALLYEGHLHAQSTDKYTDQTIQALTYFGHGILLYYPYNHPLPSEKGGPQGIPASSSALQLSRRLQVLNRKNVDTVITRATCREIQTYKDKLKFRVDCDTEAPVLLTRLLTNHNDIKSQIITKKIFEHRLTQETAN